MQILEKLITNSYVSGRRRTKNSPSPRCLLLSCHIGVREAVSCSAAVEDRDLCVKRGGRRGCVTNYEWRDTSLDLQHGGTLSCPPPRYSLFLSRIPLFLVSFRFVPLPWLLSLKLLIRPLSWILSLKLLIVPLYHTSNSSFAHSLLYSLLFLKNTTSAEKKGKSRVYKNRGCL